VWQPHTNYWNLNLREIQASVERAQEINDALAAMTPGATLRD